MPVPPMKPSAAERATLFVRECNYLPTKWTAEQYIDLAYRDGYAANDRAERMLAALREPSDALLNEVRVLRATRPNNESAHRFFAALHDLLASIATETQAQEPGR